MLTDAGCFGDAAGSIEVQPLDWAGERLPFTFRVTPPGQPAIVQDQVPLFTGLGAGAYTVVIIDSLGCESVPVEATVSMPSQLAVSVTYPSNGICGGGGTTPFIATATGGTPLPNPKRRSRRRGRFFVPQRLDADDAIREQRRSGMTRSEEFTVTEAWYLLASSTDGSKLVAAASDRSRARITTDTISTTISPTISPTVSAGLIPTITLAGGASASTSADLIDSSSSSTTRTTRGSSGQHPGRLDRQRRRIVASITLPAIGADVLRHDYDDVTSVTTNIVIDNTDVTSLTGWFPNLGVVSGNVQIRNNGELTTMTASFQNLEIISGFLDISGNGALVELGSALPFPGGAGWVTGYVSIYNNHPGAAFARLGVPRPRHDDPATAHRLRQCRVGHALE